MALANAEFIFLIIFISKFRLLGLGSLDGLEMLVENNICLPRCI